jgi:NADPH2:quinone reductase
VDHVLDLVGRDTLERSGAIVRPGGGLASVLVPHAPNSFDDLDVDYHYVFVRPDADQLTSIAKLIDAHELLVEVQNVYALQDAAQAHEQIESGHTRGKLVLRVDR